MIKSTNHIGETSKNFYGNEMTLIKYNSSKDVIVKFTDGSTKNTNYNNFKSGKVRNMGKRVGETSFNNLNEKMTIIKYNNAHDVLVQFDDGNTFTVEYSNFKKGGVKNTFSPNTSGIGFIGNGKYNSKLTSGAYDPAYQKWSSMIQRCYNPKIHETHPSYSECTVVTEWHNFQNFAEWYYKNIYSSGCERIELDKDILVKGNKIYGPETCLLVPQKINILFERNDSSSGDYPLGVCCHGSSKKFVAQCSKSAKKRGYLGIFDTPEEAFKAYKIAKESLIKQTAEEYKGKIPDKLYEAMINYKVEITD